MHLRIVLLLLEIEYGQVVAVSPQHDTGKNK